MAYFYARHSKLDCIRRGKKGFFFFLGDEGFYPNVSKNQVKAWVGDSLPNDLFSREIFAELQRTYNVFFVYPQKTWQERKADIDAEIRKRLQEAGGRYENVDFRASLIWNTYDDLDLHVMVEPESGCGQSEHIAYDNKRSRNGQGELDVDRNAGGRETRKPVENIRWAKGTAVKGKYKVFVRNYARHDDNSFRNFPIPIKVEVEINGETKSFEATISGETVSQGSHMRVTRNDVFIGEFDFDPEKRQVDPDLYAGYQDAVIKEQWAGVIPPENILIIDDPRAIVDVMLGALAITEGSVDLDQYLVDMTGRGQTALRRNQTAKSLEHLAGSTNAIVKVDGGSLPRKDSGKNRRGKAERL